MTRFYMVLGLVALSAIGGWLLGRDGTGALRAEIEAQRDSVERVTRAYEAVRNHADSLEARTDTLVDTATVYVERWRTRTDTLTITEVVALADSTINACENALVSCLATVAAKDSALEASDVRADLLAEQNERLADRLLKKESRQKWRDLLIGGLGGSVGFTVCSLTR